MPFCSFLSILTKIIQARYKSKVGLHYRQSSLYCVASSFLFLPILIPLYPLPFLPCVVPGYRAHHPFRGGGGRPDQDCHHYRGGGGGAGAGGRRGEGGQGSVSPEKGKQEQGGNTYWHKVNRGKGDNVERKQKENQKGQGEEER